MYYLKFSIQMWLTTLFSIQIASKFLKPNKKIVDLVGVQVMKASESVRHIIMPCSWSARSQVIPDIIRHHSG